jgi:hypothetical protein
LPDNQPNGERWNQFSWVLFKQNTPKKTKTRYAYSRAQHDPERPENTSPVSSLRISPCKVKRRSKASQTLDNIAKAFFERLTLLGKRETAQ